MPNKKKIVVFVDKNGNKPFIQNYQKFDADIQKKVIKGIETSFKSEHLLGDWKVLSEGVYELRFFHGMGQRVYFGLDNDGSVILLTCGRKDKQAGDILKAVEYLKQYRADKANTSEAFDIKPYITEFISIPDILPHSQERGSFYALEDIYKKIRASQEAYERDVQISEIEVRRLDNMIQNAISPQEASKLEDSLKKAKTQLSEDKKRHEITAQLLTSFEQAVLEWQEMCGTEHLREDVRYQSQILNLYKTMAAYHRGEIMEFDLQFALLTSGIELSNSDIAMLRTDPSLDLLLQSWKYIADCWLMDATNFAPLGEMDITNNPQFRSLLYQDAKFEVFVDFLQYNISSPQHEAVLESELSNLPEQQQISHMLSKFKNKISADAWSALKQEFMDSYRSQLLAKLSGIDLTVPSVEVSQQNEHDFIHSHIVQAQEKCINNPYSYEERIEFLQIYGVLEVMASDQANSSHKRFYDEVKAWKDDFEAKHDITLHSHKMAYQNLKKQLAKRPYDSIYRALLERFDNKTCLGLVTFSNTANRSARQAFLEEVGKFKASFEIENDISAHRVQQELDFCKEKLASDPYSDLYRKSYDKVVQNSSNLLRFKDHPNYSQRKSWHESMMRDKEAFLNKYDATLYAHKKEFEDLKTKLEDNPYNEIYRDHMTYFINTIVNRSTIKANKENKPAREKFKTESNVWKAQFEQDNDALLYAYQNRFDAIMERLNQDPYNMVYRTNLNILCGIKSQSGVTKHPNQAINVKRKSWFESANKIKSDFENKYNTFLHQQFERIEFLYNELEKDHYHRAYRAELDKLVKSVLASLKKTDKTKLNELLSSKIVNFEADYKNFKKTYNQLSRQNNTFEYPDNCADQKLYRFQVIFSDIQENLEQDHYDTAYRALLKLTCTQANAQLKKEKEGNVEARLLWLDEVNKYKADFETTYDLNFHNLKMLIEDVENQLSQDPYNEDLRNYYASLVADNLASMAKTEKKQKIQDGPRQQYFAQKTKDKENFFERYHKYIYEYQQKFLVIKQGLTEEPKNVSHIAALMFLANATLPRFFRSNQTKATIKLNQDIQDFKSKFESSQDKLLQEYDAAFNALIPYLEEEPYNPIYRSYLQWIVTSGGRIIEKNQSKGLLQAQIENRETWLAEKRRYKDNFEKTYDIDLYNNQKTFEKVKYLLKYKPYKESFRAALQRLDKSCRRLLLNENIDLSQRQEFVSEVKSYTDDFHQQYPITSKERRLTYAKSSYLDAHYGKDWVILDENSEDEDFEGDIEGNIDIEEGGSDIGEQNSLDRDMDTSSQESIDHEVAKPAPVTPEERLAEYNEKLLKEYQKQQQKNLEDYLSGKEYIDLFEQMHIHNNSQREDDEYEAKYIFAPLPKKRMFNSNNPDLPVIEIETPIIDPNIFWDIHSGTGQNNENITVADPSSIGAVFFTPIKGNIHSLSSLKPNFVYSPRVQLSTMNAGVRGTGNIFFKSPLVPTTGIPPSSATSYGASSPKKGIGVNGNKVFWYVMLFDIGSRSLEKRVNHWGGDGSYVPTFSNTDRFLDKATNEIDTFGGLNPSGAYMPTNELYTATSFGIKAFFESTHYVMYKADDGLYAIIGSMTKEAPLPKAFYPFHAIDSVLGTTIKWLGGDLAAEKERERKTSITSKESQFLSQIPKQLRMDYLKYRRDIYKKLQDSKVSCLDGQYPKKVPLLFFKGVTLPKRIFDQEIFVPEKSKRSHDSMLPEKGVLIKTKR